MGICVSDFTNFFLDKKVTKNQDCSNLAIPEHLKLKVYERFFINFVLIQSCKNQGCSNFPKITSKILQVYKLAALRQYKLALRILNVISLRKIQNADGGDAVNIRVIR